MSLLTRAGLTVAVTAIVVAIPQAAYAVAPDTEITSGPAYGTKVLPGTTVTYEFAAIGPSDSFVCSIDEGPYTTCTSPQSFNLPKGTHIFGVAAKSGPDTDPSPELTMWIVRNVPCEEASADYKDAQSRFFKWKTRKGYKKEALQRAKDAGDEAKVKQIKKKIKVLNGRIKAAAADMDAAVAQQDAVC